MNGGGHSVLNRYYFGKHSERLSSGQREYKQKKMVAMMTIVMIVIVTILMTVYCVPVRTPQIPLWSFNNNTRQPVQCSFNREETQGFKK